MLSDDEKSVCDGSGLTLKVDSVGHVVCSRCGAGFPLNGPDQEGTAAQALAFEQFFR